MPSTGHVKVLGIFGDARHTDVAPRSPGTRSYDQVLTAGWPDTLEGVDCLILGPPWGVVGWRQQDVPNEGSEDVPIIDSRVLRDGALWDWLATKPVTVVWAMANPADLKTIEYFDPQGISFHNYYEPLQHAIHPFYLFVKHATHDGKVWCCPGPPGAAPRALHVDWTMELQSADFVQGDPTWQPILDAISSVAGPLPQVKLEENPALRWLGFKDEAMRSQKVKWEQVGGAAGTAQLRDIRLAARHNDRRDVGLVVHGETGVGRMAIVPAKALRSKADTREIIAVAHLLHHAIHGKPCSLPDPNPTQSSEVPPSRALPRVKGSATILLKRVARELAHLGIEGDGQWTAEKVRAKLKRPRSPFFKELAGIRSKGKRRSIPAKEFHELLARHIAARADEVRAEQRAVDEAKKLKPLNPGGRAAK